MRVQTSILRAAFAAVVAAVALGVASTSSAVVPNLDIDGNGRAEATTDGLLVIRYLLGVRGDALIAGALGVGATRTNAADIQAYIASLLPPAAPPTLRGTNVVGMEMNYADFSQATGPVAGTNYPVHDTRLIDYLASKNIAVIRFLFSWEGMQSTLNGPVPASASGGYKAYFDNYKRIVDYATNVKGMRVIVEPWQANSGGGAGGAMWRGNLVGSGAVPTAAFADFWGKMAGVFAANPLVSFGLVNEPNNQSTMQWWSAAQAAISAIRGAGATQRIYVPGNGYSAASSWIDNFYDTAATKRSNAYGWLNANGPGVPINDPQNDLVAEVHVYVDPDESGSSTTISSTTAARDHIAITVNEAAAHGYKVFIGEIGWYAAAPGATAAWADFVAYFGSADPAVLTGYAWWAAGAPGWWDDVAANGGGHFSITPTNGATFTGDTVNMTLIQGNF